MNLGTILVTKKIRITIDLDLRDASEEGEESFAEPFSDQTNAVLAAIVEDYLLMDLEETIFDRHGWTFDANTVRVTDV